MQSVITTGSNSFVALSGLPRTGSTLLSAILNQNPNVHAEGNSAVCWLMWSMQQTCETVCNEQLRANYREGDQDVLVSSIPKTYYRNVKKKYIVDKCRSWALPANVNLIRRYITPNPKILVLTRPIEEIVDSFERLYKKNNMPFHRSQMYIPGSEPLMRSLMGVEYAKSNNQGEFLFIDYHDLVQYPNDVIQSIYSFCEWEEYKHDFDNIVNEYPENDEIYGLIGMHDIRSKVSFSK